MKLPSEQAVMLPDSTPTDLIFCLRASIPPYSSSSPSFPLVLEPEADGALWSSSIKPYNTRLEGSLGPLAVVYAETPSIISSAVQCAKRAHVPAIARSGGHSYGAYSLGGAIHDDPSLPKAGSSRKKPPPPAKHDPDLPIPSIPSLVIDMRGFRSIAYDDITQTVSVGSGALLGEMNEVLERHGRTVPTGACPTVGVGGQALAGGFGLMSRSLGLLLDNLISIDVVLANGEIVTASETEYPDLYWGLRGAGPSLGIAHTLTFRTHPAPPQIIYFELTLLPRNLPISASTLKRSTDLFLAFQEFGASEAAVPELGMSWHVTPEKGVDGVWGSKVEILGQFSGSEEEFENVWGEFEQMLRSRKENKFQRGHRKLTFLESMHNVGGNWTRLEDRGPMNINEHVNFYAKSLLTKTDLPSSAIQTHLAHLLSLAPVQNPSTGIEWFVLSPFLGGPESAVVKNGGNDHLIKNHPPKTSAFAHRDLKIVWEIYAKHLNDEYAKKSKVNLVELVKGMAEDLGKPEAVYPAYVDPELTASQYPSLIWGSAYPRLQKLKAIYDPDNLFRSPQSVRLVPRRHSPASYVKAMTGALKLRKFAFGRMREASRASSTVPGEMPHLREPTDFEIDLGPWLIVFVFLGVLVFAYQRLKRRRGDPRGRKIRPE